MFNPNSVSAFGPKPLTYPARGTNTDSGSTDATPLQQKINGLCEALFRDLPPDLKAIRLGRKKESYSHEGNIRFRALVDQLASGYGTIEKRIEKADYSKSIISNLELNGAYFVSKSADGHWTQVAPHNKALEKVTHALRDKLCSMEKKQKSGQEPSVSSLSFTQHGDNQQVSTPSAGHIAFLKNNENTNVDDTKPAAKRPTPAFEDADISVPDHYTPKDDDSFAGYFDHADLDVNSQH